MTRARSLVFVAPALFSLACLAACGSSGISPTDPSLQTVPVLPAAPPPHTGKPGPRPLPPPPSAEMLKKAEAQKALEQDRAKMKADHEAEAARITPAIREEAKKLADQAFPSGKAAIQAMAKGKHRAPGHIDRDKARHPAETLEFLGFKPNMTVLEYGPGEGWYTELLAPALAKSGKLLVTNGDPNGPETERPTYYAQRFKLFTDRLPEAYGKVEAVTIDGRAPRLGHDAQVDLALVFRGLHGMVNGGTLNDWLAQIHASLKPNGVLGIEQHRAKPDAKAEDSAKKGYLPEKWVIEQVEAAGFKLAGKSEVNANPKDTKDYADGVWTLPPSFTLGDKDREKFAAIGESDRMTLKFVKVSKSATPPKPAVPAKPAASAAPAAPTPKK